MKRMSKRLGKAVQRWLSAERRGAAEAADRALRVVFRALPLATPSAGFVDRVMTRAGLAPARAVGAPVTASMWGWRAALGASMLMAAAAAAAAPAVVLALLGRVSAGDLIGLAADAVVETGQRLAEGLAAWRVLNVVGGALSEALATPQMLAALVVATLLSAGGFRMLYGLLAVERRNDNARA